MNLIIAELITTLILYHIFINLVYGKIIYNKEVVHYTPSVVFGVAMMTSVIFRD
jgi:hypothetical protein